MTKQEVEAAYEQMRAKRRAYGDLESAVEWEQRAILQSAEKNLRNARARVAKCKELCTELGLEL